MGDVGFGVLIPSLLLCGCAAFAFLLVRQYVWRRRAWRSGHTAEGHCVETWTTTSTSSGSGNRPSRTTTTRHHRYSYRPAGAAKPVEFEEAEGPSGTVAGTRVTIYYDPAHPSRATAHQPGAKQVFHLVLGLAICAAVAAMGATSFWR